MPPRWCTFTVFGILASIDEFLRSDMVGEVGAIYIYIYICRAVGQCCSGG